MQIIRNIPDFLGGVVQFYTFYCDNCVTRKGTIMSSNVKNVLRSNKAKGAGIAVASVAVVGLLFAGGSGAAFTASDTGNVDIKTATLNLSLTDNGGSAGTFNLNYANLAPGQQQTQVFYVTNTGTIPAEAKLGQPVTPTSIDLTGLTPAEVGQLQVGVDGVANPVSITSLPASFDLGTIQPGATKTVTLRVGLDGAAGNHWQGKHVAANATVTLTQQ